MFISVLQAAIGTSLKEVLQSSAGSESEQDAAELGAKLRRKLYQRQVYDLIKFYRREGQRQGRPWKGG